MRRLPLLLLILLFISGCAAPTPQTTDLNIYAASSLTEAMSEIGEAFKLEHPDANINYNFAGSQLLRTQIEAGAPADVFTAANEDEMNSLVASGLVNPDNVHVFATNLLTAVVSSENPGQIFSLEDLAKPGIKIVMADQSVPAGVYGRQVLSNLDQLYGATYSAQVLANVVSNETSVRSVLSRVELGEADAGIVYASDVRGLDLLMLDIPAEYNVEARYMLGMLNNAPNPKMAQLFAEFILSARGQGILRKWGFGNYK